MSKSLVYISFKDFNEQNISLKPAAQDIFRLRVEGFKQTPSIIIITRQKVVVKKGTEYLYQDEDTNRLTPVERLHFKILQYRYPLQNILKNKTRHPYFDSLITLYPQLLQASYLKYLCLKVLVPREHPYSYTTATKKISYSTFYSLITQLNAIGYWKMPDKLPCSSDYSDGDWYSLEANTAKKYNYVSATSCNEHDAFAKVCQQIIKLAGLDDKIQLYDDPAIPKKPQEPVKVIEQDVILDDAPKPLNNKRK